jgi:DNA-directed RNA polymerase specialized sigma24 family protein
MPLSKVLNQTAEIPTRPDDNPPAWLIRTANRLCRRRLYFVADADLGDRVHDVLLNVLTLVRDSGSTLAEFVSRPEAPKVVRRVVEACRSQARRDWRRRLRPLPRGDGPALALEPADLLAEREDAVHTLGRVYAVARLSPTERRYVALTSRGEHSTEELCHVLGIDARRLPKLKHKALKKMREVVRFLRNG